MQKKMSILFRAAAAAAAILLAVGLFVAGHCGLAKAGPFAILFFAALALALRLSATGKSFSYTVLIFGAAVMALYYPGYFISYGDFRYAVLVVPLIQLIMFGMGTSMHYADFLAVLKTPRGILIGVFSHFIIMPLLGFSIATIGMKFAGIPAEIAAGIILIGCCPNGMASNVVSYLAKANLALSITITGVSTLLSPVITPALMGLLAGSFVKINAWQMVFDIIKMVMVPIGAGLVFSSVFKRHTGFLKKVMPLVSMFGIICIIIIITAAGRDSLLRVGVLLAVLVLAHNIGGYCLGFWAARLFNMDERDCRTIAIEVGMQNGGMAAGLAKSMGRLATLGLAPVIFSTIMNVTGSLLANYWHKKPLKPRIDQAVRLSDGGSN